MENWKSVAGWEGWYEVSDKGRVRSLTRKSIANGAPATYKGVLLKCSIGKNGYARVTFTRPQFKQQRYVHDLVAEAFIGPRAPSLEVCHADGTRTNNTLSNLRYGSRSENARDRIQHGRGPTGEKTRGENNGNVKLTKQDVTAIRGMSGTLKQIAAVFGVHLATIHCIRSGKTWKE